MRRKIIVTCIALHSDRYILYYFQLNIKPIFWKMHENYLLIPASHSKIYSTGWSIGSNISGHSVLLRSYDQSTVDSFIYPYPSGLIHWYWGNLMIALLQMKYPWEISVKTQQNTTKHEPCAYFLKYSVRQYNYILSWRTGVITINDDVSVTVQPAHCVPRHDIDFIISIYRYPSTTHFYCTEITYVYKPFFRTALAMYTPVQK